MKLIKRELECNELVTKKMQIQEILQFSSVSFHILKLLRDSLFSVVIVYYQCG